MINSYLSVLRFKRYFFFTCTVSYSKMDAICNKASCRARYYNMFFAQSLNSAFYILF